LRLGEMPGPADAARPTDKSLKPSPALSILRNGPDSFKGRKIGALVTDGVDADLLRALKQAVEEEGATLKLVAPMVGGVTASDGTFFAADEKIDGGPSVLFDAVALLVGGTGAAQLADMPPARDFVSDALQHQKFIGYVGAARPLLARIGANPSADGGMIELDNPGAATGFIEACRKLRFWARGRKDEVAA
jgi:catalase